MARSISEIEKDLFALPIQERARIAHVLIRSLDKDKEPLSREEGGAVWLEEIQRREEEIDSGKVKLVSHDEVMVSLAAALKK
jgi:putative addiction module component (TIGR02574 family)